MPVPNRSAWITLVENKEKSVKFNFSVTEVKAAFLPDPLRVCSIILENSSFRGPDFAFLRYWSKACSRERPASEQRDKTSRALGNSLNNSLSRFCALSLSQIIGKVKPTATLITANS